MSLKANLILIFIIILFLLLCVALFPSAELIFVVMLLSTALIVFQAILVLKDKG